MFQTKEKDKTPEELREAELRNSSSKEFNITITKMLKELGRRMPLAPLGKPIAFFVVVQLLSRV